MRDEKSRHITAVRSRINGTDPRTPHNANQQINPIALPLIVHDSKCDFCQRDIPQNSTYQLTHVCHVSRQFGGASQHPQGQWWAHIFFFFFFPLPHFPLFSFGHPSHPGGYKTYFWVTWTSGTIQKVIGERGIILGLFIVVVDVYNFFSTQRARHRRGSKRMWKSNEYQLYLLNPWVHVWLYACSTAWGVITQLSPRRALVDLPHAVSLLYIYTSGASEIPRHSSIALHFFFQISTAELAQKQQCCFCNIARHRPLCTFSLTHRSFFLVLVLLFFLNDLEM